MGHVANLIQNNSGALKIATLTQHYANLLQAKTLSVANNRENVSHIG
jgi:hypothetical protein